MAAGGGSVCEKMPTGTMAGRSPPEDVKFTFEYQAAHHGALAWLRTLIKDITIQGQMVSFELTKPHGRFLVNCGFIVRILPKHVWESVEDPFKPGDAQVTLGCGPFVFEKLDLHAGCLSFKRNENYHGALSAVEELDIYLDRSFDTLALSLQRGDLDLYYKYASGFPPAHLAALNGKPGLTFPVADAMGVPAALGFNMARRPMKDLAFRQAIAVAIDYKRIGASLLGDSGKPPDAGFIPPAFINPLPNTLLAYAPQGSGQLLDDAGYADTNNDGLRNFSDGGNIDLTLLCRGDLAGTEALLPILSHNLKTVGISLNIERADLSTWIERVHTGKYDLVLFRTTPWGMVMDAGMGSGYFDSRRQGGGTLANVTDPVFHDLCDRLLATTDADRQMRLQQAVQKYYADHLPALSLCWAINTYPIQSAWQNITINQIEGGLLNRQTLARIQYKKSDK